MDVSRICLEFLVTEGSHLDQGTSIRRRKWNFSNLDAAFEDGGVLHMEKVFLFARLESHTLSFDGQTDIPVIVAIVSPFPPSDKVAIVQMDESEEIMDMEDTDVCWVSYPQLNRYKVDPSILGVVRDIFLPLSYKACVPYFNNPFKADSVVDIIYQTNSDSEPMHFAYHWEETPERFTNALLAFNQLPRDHKDSFQEILKKKGEDGRRACHKAQEESRSLGRDATGFEQMRFYKFYPVATPDTPDISFKSPFINKYYGDAHQVF